MTRMRLSPFMAVSISLLVAGLPFGTGAVRAQSAGPEAAHDCGAVALYLLLRSEGYKTSLRALKSLLPAPTADGRSMKELRDGARALGAELRGVTLAREDRAIDRPMIALLKFGHAGHFTFIRPVGHTGKLVQVLDPEFETAVVDKADLLARPEWTGLALVATGDTRPWHAGCVLLAVAAGAAGWLVLKRFGSIPRRQGRLE